MFAQDRPVSSLGRLQARPGNRELGRVLAACFRAGDWDGLSAQIAAMPPQAAYDALRLLGGNLPHRSDLVPLLRRGDCLSLVIAAAILHTQAWRHRGYGPASDISEKQWNLYGPRIEQAQELLLDATALDPDSGLAAAWLATAFFDEDQDSKDMCEQALIRASDVPAAGWSNLLTGRAKKWAGSHTEMFRVARRFSGADSPGTLSLIAAAHYERWLWDAAFETDPDIAAMSKTYFERPAVWDEICDASERCLAATHPDARNILWADGWFARLFCEIGSLGWAAPHLERLGGHVDVSIWRRPRPGFWLNIKRMEAGLMPVVVDS
jgi:prepilin-type processing-associated H-X9-DG protein